MTYTKNLPLSFVALFFFLQRYEIKLFMVHFHRHKYIVLIPPADNINILSCITTSNRKKQTFYFHPMQILWKFQTFFFLLQHRNISFSVTRSLIFYYDMCITTIFSRKKKSNHSRIVNMVYMWNWKWIDKHSVRLNKCEISINSLGGFMFQI